MILQTNEIFLISFRLKKKYPNSPLDNFIIEPQERLYLKP